MPKKTKTGGRQKGTPNKVNATIREQLDKLWSSAFDLVLAKKDIEQLSPANRVDFLMKLTAFIVPKPVAVPKDDEGNSIVETIKKFIEQD